jgi:hypothetical protein
MREMNNPMPWFRFIEEARVTLPFRNGPGELTFANLPGEDGWAWVAQKVKSPGPQIVLVRTGNVMALNAALMRRGFEVPSGSHAEKVMRAAVKCRYAEELPDDEHWRHQLILARDAARKS